MAAKKYFLIKVWDCSGKKTKDRHDGFELKQERVISCYESNIKNLHVAKGLRATYEEVEKPKETADKRPTTK